MLYGRCLTLPGRDELNTCVPHGEPMWPDMTGKRQEQTAAHRTELDTALEAAWTVGSKWWKNNSFIVTMSIVLFVYPVGSQWWTTATRIGVSNLWLKNCILTYQNFGPCMYVCTLWFLVFFLVDLQLFPTCSCGNMIRSRHLILDDCENFEHNTAEMWRMSFAEQAPTNSLRQEFGKKHRPHRSFQQYTCFDTGWEQMWFHIHVWEIRCMSK